MNSITVFSPATVANLSCGFDVLGLALEGIGDRITLKLTSDGAVTIAQTTGYDTPVEPEKNVAGRAALSMLSALGSKTGVALTIHKGIKPGSGIGSSAASAAGVVWGLNELLNQPFKRKDLVAFAMEGERLASGEATADNVAPAILGGITLVRSHDPLDVINLNVPSQLFVTVIHPHIEIRTEEARKVLTAGISLKQGIQQWANVGALVAGFYEEDYALISRALEDVVIEPQRAHLLPQFKEFKSLIKAHNALGGGISGSGPSMYCLCQGKKNAQHIAKALDSLYQNSGVGFDIYTSPINTVGCRKL